MRCILPIRSLSSMLCSCLGFSCLGVRNALSIFSNSRTDTLLSIPFCASLSCASGFSTTTRQRACPGLKRPSATKSITAWLNVRSRNVFAIAGRLLPMRSATSSCVYLYSSISCLIALAVSMGLRSSRCKFSMSEISFTCCCV